MSTAEFASRAIGESPWSRNILGHMVGEFGATDALLRARCDRPRGRRAAEKCDELAAFHSITSSARPSRIDGTSKPKALAALRLITNSNLVPCWTGKSAGFTPLRILSTKLAERYHVSLRLTE